MDLNPLQTKKISLNKTKIHQTFPIISRHIVDWFNLNGRHDLPWRKNVTPYRIWISEVMLQQTQVKTALPYFQKFMGKYPTLKKLSLANEDEILAAWSGLGFYRRARNIFATKEIIKNTYNNIFPKTFESILSLPGIGRSTAGAILSLAYNEATPILDGNVKRVISRIIKKDQATIKEKEFWELSTQLVNHKYAFSFTQGVMDLGATVCSPSNPNCTQCPIKIECESAFKVKPQVKLARKDTKKVVSIEFALFQTSAAVLLSKNIEGSIWNNLWLPFERMALQNMEDEVTYMEQIKMTHELTHRTFKLTFHIFKSSKQFKPRTNQQYEWVKKDRIEFYGMPKPITKVISQL